MSSVNNGSQGFASLHTIGFNFKGVFQLRLATDADPADEPRGKLGWTFAYDNEPDFDRIIRFNNPTTLRSFVSKVGVIITDAFIDNQYVQDSIIGQTVNLGPNSYFDGSNGADGHEPIINFEFHVGNNEDYIYSETNEPPLGKGAHPTTLPLPLNLTALINSRIQALQSSKNEIDKSRLKNIRRSLTAMYGLEVMYDPILDKNIVYNPMNSELVTLMEQRQIDRLSLIMNFYGYDGDGLIGYVNGQVTGVSRELKL